MRGWDYWVGYIDDIEKGALPMVPPTDEA